MLNTHSRSNFIAGGILIGLGLLLLLSQVLTANVWRYAWPVILTGVGLLFFVGMLVSGRSAGGLAVPGSLITGLGLILLYQNLTQHWTSWSYVWTLFLCFSGVGLWISGWWSQKPQQRQSGRSLLGVGLILFLVFGAFFELSTSLFGVHQLSSVLWALALIGVGVYWLVTRLRGR